MLVSPLSRPLPPWTPAQRRNRGSLTKEGVCEGGEDALVSWKAMATEAGQARTLLEAGECGGRGPCGG